MVFKKIQNLPEEKKKIILWIIVGTVALILLIVWLKRTAIKINNLQGEEMINKSNLSKIKEALKNISFPSFSQFLEKIQSK